MNKQERNTLKRIGALFRMMMAGGTPNERDQAREKLEKLLRKSEKTLNDMPNLMAQLAEVEQQEEAEKAAEQAAAADDPRTTQQTAAKARDIPCLELVDFFLRDYLELQDHEYTAMALWTLHTHIFSRFMCTPRLTFVSPAPDCGKTTAMSILERLAFKADKNDSATPASLYWLLDQGPRTLLLDEMDNAESRNAELRRVLNSGHRRGGGVRRYIGGRSKRFSTFTPVALAAIGTNRPLPSAIISRSIVVKMQRAKRELRRFDASDTSDLDAVFQQIWLWAQSNPKLELEPAMPAGMRNRARDNWTPLVAIADSFGPAWGTLARKAASSFKTGRDEDIGILLLEDSREVFNTLSVDRITSRALVDALCDLEGAGWAEYQGRRLTPGLVAKIFAPFGIEPKVIWPLQRTRTSRSARG
jgi:hypothetical protein